MTINRVARSFSLASIGPMATSYVKSAGVSQGKSMSKPLGSYKIKAVGDRLHVHIEDSEGGALEFTTTYKQLDRFAEDIDAALDQAAPQIASSGRLAIGERANRLGRRIGCLIQTLRHALRSKTDATNSVPVRA
jgi:hypothetical protein